MAHGGAAWRGWFPLDGELTSGRPDHKEGHLLRHRARPDHPAVRAGRPLHGANLFPAAARRSAARPCSAGSTRMTGLGAALLRAIAIGLGLRAGLVRPPRHRRPDRAVPHLPLPARPMRRRLGRRPSTPTTGC